MDQSQFRSLGSVSQPHTTGLPGTVPSGKKGILFWVCWMSEDEADSSQNPVLFYSGVLMNTKWKKIASSFHIHPVYEDYHSFSFYPTVL